jgi:predicted metalloprotease with PDZ domain
MIRARSNWKRTALLTALLFAARPARATIDYSVSVAHPERHLFGVTMRMPNVHERVLVQMPAWNALYQIRDFSSHMMQVTAKDEAGNTLPIVKLDKETWQVAGNGALTVSYPIFWDEPGPFASQLNPDHAFLNLAMVLLYVPDRRAEDTRVVFDDLPENWRVAVELEAAGADSSSTLNAPGEAWSAPTSGLAAGRRSVAYAAPSYDALVDAPVELGAFDEFHIEAGGRPIRIVVHGDSGDRSRLTDALKRIVDYEVSLMGGAPFREYLFLFHVGTVFGGGGMEHANCTAISADVPGQLAAYSAHEFFHAWNVKRIRPKSLEPVDFTREMWTKSLWFAEGVTNTYGAYAMVRTGLWSTQQFYGNLAGQISELESRPAHRWQSVEQSSLDAWYEKYPAYTRPEESISYYNKGQLVGLALDLLIRDRTDNRAGLDDMLRVLNDEFARRGRFYNESEDLRAVAENVIRGKAPSVNPDLQDFFVRYVSGTDEIPFDDLLGRAGWLLKDTGQRRASFGFAIHREGNAPPSIGGLEAGSAAQEVGLQEGDILLALNGDSLPRTPERWLRDHQPGERLKVKVRRSGAEKEFSFVLGRQSDAVYQIVESPDSTEKQRRIRDGILHGTVGATR